MICTLGSLNHEEFALAMYLVQQKLDGIDPPPALTPEMVPPSQRPNPPAEQQKVVFTIMLFIKTAIHIICFFFFKRNRKSHNTLIPK